MFRTTIRADENSDADALVASLRGQCERAGMLAPIPELVATQAREVLVPLVERGREVAGLGSQMHVTREISGEGFSIKLVFRANDRRSLWVRLIDAIRGQ